MIVNYKGKTLETINYTSVTDSERLDLKSRFFEKPDFSEVKKQLQKLSKDGVMMDKVTRYYFKEIMAKTLIKGNKWTVEEVFESNDLLGVFKAKTFTNSRIFDSDDIAKNLDKAFRLGGHGIASLPPQFPMATARNIIKKYNINDNWYDFSCGWGVRLLCAMSEKVNYFGTDPNYLLTDQLNLLVSDYKANIGLTTLTDIRTQGSQEFIPEWENTMGLAFSSPPYFDLEDYVVGAQSYTSQTSYTQWQENYLIPTLLNIYRYLIDDGQLAINIKNNKAYKLADDTKALAAECGFTLTDIELLTNNQRVTPSGPLNNAENIFIFKKNHEVKISVPEKIKEKLIEDEVKNASEPISIIENQIIDIFLIGVKSKKQLEDINIYNSENIFLGERYFATFSSTMLSMISFLQDYSLNKYVELTKDNVIELLEYAIYHRDNNNSFKTVNKLCEIVDTWDEMESQNFHLFLQIENN